MSYEPEDALPTEGVRLQKALAQAGVASRRACETLIASGRVTINGRRVQELGTRINPASDEVHVDGVLVQLDTTKRYYVLNKPLDVVSSMSDDRGRRDLREFTFDLPDRVYNVGRLDADTTGLLILTNDGELAHQLAHPAFGVQKTYVAKVRGAVTPAVIQRLKQGVELDDGPIQADSAKLLTQGRSNTHSLVEITLHSGRNRIVRRMLDAVGHPVDELVRRQFGPLHLGTLGIGEIRELSDAERGALITAVNHLTKGRPQKANRVTAGRPGDGKGARGMRGIAAQGNPHGRGDHSGKSRGAVASTGRKIARRDGNPPQKGSRS